MIHLTLYKLLLTPENYKPGSHKVECQIISLLTEFKKNSHLDVFILELVNHFHV